MIAQAFTPADVRRMADLVSQWLPDVFHLQGDQGTGRGIFSVVGKGDGSMDDSYRPAEPRDSLYDYHHTLNARQLPPPYGELFVHTRSNRPEIQGVFIPDITGMEQPGSNLALYGREELVTLIVELFLRATFLMNHQPGLILPNKPQAEIVRPESHEGLLLSKLQTVSANQVVSGGLQACLSSLAKIRHNLQFAVVVSDFLSPGWGAKLMEISRSLKVIAFHVIDPWDIALPNLGGSIVFRQGGQRVTIDTRNKKARDAYRQQAGEKQHYIDSVLADCRARHYKITTTKPLLDQMSDTLRLSPVAA